MVSDNLKILLKALLHDVPLMYLWQAGISPDQLSCLCFTKGPGMGAPLQAVAVVVRTLAQVSLCAHALTIVLVADGVLQSSYETVQRGSLPGAEHHCNRAIAPL